MIRPYGLFFISWILLWESDALVVIIDQSRRSTSTSTSYPYKNLRRTTSAVTNERLGKKPQHHFKTSSQNSVIYASSDSQALESNEKVKSIFQSLPASLISFKTAVIIALMLQNSSLSILMRISRTTVQTIAHPMYISSTAVMCSEFLKLIASLTIYYMTGSEKKNPDGSKIVQQKRPLIHLFFDIPSLLDVSIPSGLYVLQNNLQYIATTSLPAAAYQVLVQIKLITTAIFSTFYLKRSLSLTKWFSVFSLTIGVIIVQLSVQSTKTATGVIDLPKGLLSVGLSCLTSAFAGVKLEALLKEDPDELWGKNSQLCFVSLVMAAIVSIKDFEKILTSGFFSGYSPLVWGVIGIHAIGGILVSLVVQQTSSVVKGFTTSGSIILTSLVSAFILKDIAMNAQFFAGALLVCISTLLYSKKRDPVGNFLLRSKIKST